MKYKISSFSVIVSFLCLSIIGLGLLPHIPVKLVPVRAQSTLSVGFSMPGQAPRVVESKVTTHIEAMLNRIKGVTDISSVSGNGNGYVNITLDKNADMDMVRFEVSTAIRQLWPQLPEGTTYPTIQTGYSDDKAAYPFLVYSLNAPLTSAQIANYAEKKIRTRLANIEGLSRIEITGATPMEWQLEYDYDRLTALEMTAGDISRAVSESLNGEYLGMCVSRDEAGKELFLRLIRPAQVVYEFDPHRILVKNVSGMLVPLDQLVKVTYREQEPRSYFRINGLNTVYINLYASERANQLLLSDQVKETLRDIQEKFPPGYELHKSSDNTNSIKDEIHKIEVRTVLSLLILLLFIFLISRNLRYLFLIVCSLMINLCIALIGYYLFGVEIQLYSLAGITVSLGLILDNIIVRADSLLYPCKQNVFTALLAATLTTIAALTVVFFLDENIRLNLRDFAVVLIINFVVSLLIVLLLIPALVDRLHINLQTVRKQRKFTFLKKEFTGWTKRHTIYFNRLYEWFIRFGYRFRKSFLLLFLLLFGIPFFMLPNQFEEKEPGAAVYNATFGSRFYNEYMRSWVNVLFGGTFRLFMQNSYTGEMKNFRGETRLDVQAIMPNGTTLKETNETVRMMEACISQYGGIRQFRTNIYSPRYANIEVTFTKEGDKEGIPYQMKSELISKAINLGNASWTVTGIDEIGFNNHIYEEAGSFRVKMAGYNYDDLMEYALAFRKKLMSHQRIKEVLILPDFRNTKDDFQEILFTSDPELLAVRNLSVQSLYGSVNPIFSQEMPIGTIYGEDGSPVPIKLHSSQAAKYDIWNLKHDAREASGHSFRMDDVASITKDQAPQQVNKQNQQYNLCLQFDYIGDYQNATEILKQEVDTFSQKLPLGYSIAEKEQTGWWFKAENRQYLLLFPIVLVIFFICSILYNSLTRPVAVILTIPIAYIGVFLTFGLLNIKFGQGGFAAFILLTGLTGNSAIYILNEYDAILKKNPAMRLRSYLKAFNYKIVPVFLTVISTALGFMPFLFERDKDDFWISLSVGTIGGLVFSLIGILFFLPLIIGLFSTRRKVGKVD